MTEEALPPAKRPCPTCPYLSTTPSGLWHPSEYQRLPMYDRPTMEQPVGMLLCHQTDGRVCAGWASCHDQVESLSLRLALSMGRVSPATYEAIIDYQSPVPIFASGAEAAAHGLAETEAPGPAAQRAAEKLLRHRTDMTIMHPDEPGPQVQTISFEA